MTGQNNNIVHDLKIKNKEVDTKQLRNNFGLFSTGVTVVTTIDNNNIPIGMTVNSFASVSLNPPLVLWSIDKNQPTYESFLNSKGYAVNILSKDQIDLCYKFSNPSENKFKDIDWEISGNGFPIIMNCLAWFDCLSWANYPGGDHQILVGKVDAYGKNENNPLTFWNGNII